MARITETANGEKSQIDFKEITSFIVEELSKRNLLRKGATTYQNTESLLYKYNDLKNQLKTVKKKSRKLKQLDYVENQRAYLKYQKEVIAIMILSKKI